MAFKKTGTTSKDYAPLDAKPSKKLATADREEMELRARRKDKPAPKDKK